MEGFGEANVIGIAGAERQAFQYLTLGVPKGKGGLGAATVDPKLIKSRAITLVFR